MGQTFKRIAAVVVTALLVTGIAFSGVIAYEKYQKSDQASALKYYEKKDKDTDDKKAKEKKQRSKKETEAPEVEEQAPQDNAQYQPQTEQRSYYVAPKQAPVKQERPKAEQPKKVEKSEPEPPQQTQPKQQPACSETQPAQNQAPSQSQSQNAASNQTQAPAQKHSLLRKSQMKIPALAVISLSEESLSIVEVVFSSIDTCSLFISRK